MKKKLKITGSDGLMIYFTKEDQEIHGLEKGDLVDLSDMIVEKLNKKKVKK